MTEAELSATEEIRKAIENGDTVDLVWAPFTTKSIPSYRSNYGHRSAANLDELEDLVREHGLPMLAFIGATEHYYIRN